MAIILDLNSEKTFEVILSSDDAVDSENSDAYEDYLVNLNEDLLPLLPGKTIADCTRWVFKRYLKYDQSQALMSQRMKVSAGKVDFQAGSIMEEVRLSLCDIKNPASLPENKKIIWKKDNDAATSKELIAALDAAGLVNELYRAKTTYLNIENKKTDDLKKKLQHS